MNTAIQVRFKNCEIEKMPGSLKSPCKRELVFGWLAYERSSISVTRASPVIYGGPCGFCESVVLFACAFRVFRKFRPIRPAKLRSFCVG